MQRAARAERASSFGFSQLSDPVEVIHDNHGRGMYRAWANTGYDVFFTQGVLHAQTRLWSMESQRRLIAGTLSSIAGSGALDIDKFSRTVGLSRFAERSVERLSPNAKSVLQAYTDGVNAYLNTNPPMPAELVLLGRSMDPWTIADSYRVGAVLALFLSSNAPLELQRYHLEQIRGLNASRVDELIMPFDTDLFPTVLSQEDAQRGLTATTGGPGRYNTSREAEVREEARQRAMEGKRLLREESLKPEQDEGDEDLENRGGDAALLPSSWIEKGIKGWLKGVRGGSSASNNWAISGNHTASGFPFLANDPHLSFTTPGTWMLMHLRAADSGLDALGASVPGLPGIFSGRNRFISWGLTNSGIDVQDLFVLDVCDAEGSTEGVDPKQARYYLHNGEVLAMNVRRERVKVARGSDETITVRETIYGPIVNENKGLETWIETDTMEGLYLENGFDKALALSWTSTLDPVLDGTVESIVDMNRARNWTEFREALSKFVVPCQVFVFASASGDIGLQVPGLVPLRAPGHDGRRPVPGNGSYDWQGFVPFDDMPRTFNPARGFVTSSNNRITPPSGFPVPISPDWGTRNVGYRAKRLETLLQDAIASGEAVTMEHMRSIQLDRHSIFASQLVPVLETLEEFQEEVSLSAASRAMLPILLPWNGSMEHGERGATVFQAWTRQVVMHLAAEESGRTRWANWNLIREAILSDSHRGGPGTDRACVNAGYSTCDAFAAAMLNRASAELPDEIPPWGALESVRDGPPSDGKGSDSMHPAAFAHLGLDTTPLRCLFSRFDRGSGSSFTIAKGTPDLADPTLPMVFGPLLRVLVDMGESPDIAPDAPVASRILVAPGQSGNLFSPNYDNLLDVWGRDELLELRFTPDDASAERNNL